MKHAPNRLVWLLPVLLLVAVGWVSLPLTRPGFFVSDDGGWMIVRLSAFFQSLREGQFPVRFLGRLFYGYGYPVSNFLYPGFLYVGSLIHILGLSFIDTVKVILGGSLVVGTLCTYMWLRAYFRAFPSFVGSLGYIFAPYLLFDVYKRGSVGEVLALGIAPVALYAVASSKKWLLGLVVPLLILSHNSLALLFVGCIALYIVIRREWKRLWLMLGTGIGMATFFWFPALYERKYVVFDRILVANPGEHFIQLSTLHLVGLAGVIAVLFSFLLRSPKQKEKGLFVVLFLAAVFLALPVSGFIWKWPLLAHIFQFPYRFLSLSVVVGAWLMAYAIEHSRKLLGILLATGFILIGVSTTNSVLSSVDPTDQPEGYYSTNDATTNVADEYTPRWVGVKPTARPASKLEFYAGHGAITPRVVTTQTIDVDVSADEPSVIQVNTFYYPGWGATLDGQKVLIAYQNAGGVMRVAVPQGDHRLVIDFRETISRFLADVISVGSIIVYGILLFV